MKSVLAKHLTPAQKTFMDLVELHRTTDWLATVEAQEIRAMVYTLQALDIDAIHVSSHSRFCLDGKPHATATLRALKIDGELIDASGNIGGPAIRAAYKRTMIQSLSGMLGSLIGKPSVQGEPWRAVHIPPMGQVLPTGPRNGASTETFVHCVERGISELAAKRLSENAPFAAKAHRSPRL